MRLAERTDYALRTLLLLAATDQRLQVPHLAQALNVSANHLSKVVQALTEAGYLATTRGRSGGVNLIQPPHTINVGNVVRLMEPDFNLVECFSDSGDCNLFEACNLKHLLSRAQQAFLTELDTTTLADLIHRKKTQLQQIGLPAA